MPGERDARTVRERPTVPRRSDGRVPPHNLQAEESVLGALLLSREAIGAVSEQGLQPGRLLQARRTSTSSTPIRALYSTRRAGRHGHRRRRAAPRRAARRGRRRRGAARAAERHAGDLQRRPLRQDRPGHGAAAPPDPRRRRHRRDRLQRARRRHQGARRGRDQGVQGRRAAGHRLAPGRSSELAAGGDGPPRGDVRPRRHRSPAPPPATHDLDELLSGLQPVDAEHRRRPPGDGQDGVRPRAWRPTWPRRRPSRCSCSRSRWATTS